MIASFGRSLRPKLSQASQPHEYTHLRTVVFNACMISLGFCKKCTYELNTVFCVLVDTGVWGSATFHKELIMDYRKYTSSFLLLKTTVCPNPLFLLVKIMYLFLLDFHNVATFEPRSTTPLILLVLSLMKKILWEKPKKTVPIFLVSLCTNTTVLKMMILTLGKYKCNTDPMILLVIFLLLKYRMSLVNVTLNLSFSW